MIDCIKGPPEGHAHAGVTDLASYRAVHSAAMIRAEKTAIEVPDPRDAYINHGRWVVDCTCNGAGLTSPAFGLTCCFDCGSVYTSVVFPSDHEEIESALMTRTDETTRNWRGETVAQLRSETA